MSALLDFLNEMFGPDSGATSEDIKNHFINDLGVMTDIVDDLYLFKYDMISVKWNAITFECRGTIMARLPDGYWKYVSRPPDKFFNLREGHCIYSNNAKFIEDFDKLELRQKADGTAIQMYFWNGTWRISTLGKIVPAKVNGYGFTFADLFLNIFGADNLQFANPEFCYFHELCSVHNIIVTHYPEDKVFLILARNVKTGDYLSTDEIDRIAREDFKEATLGRLKVSDLPLSEKSLEGLEAYVESVADDPKYGTNSEGFVLSNPVPLGKVKNHRYLILHRLIGGGDKGHTVNNLIDMLFSGLIDDYYADLSEIQKKAIDSLKNKISNINSQLEEFYVDALSSSENRKEFALKVQSNKELSRFSPYLFNRYVDSTISSFSEWLVTGKSTKNWTKFEDIWKAEFTL